MINMNSELLKTIDEAIEELNEDLDKKKQAQLLAVAKQVDPKIPGERINWTESDNKWNELVNLIVDKNAARGNGRSARLVAVDAKDENGNPITDNYILWDEASKRATLTNKESATPLGNEGRLFIQNTLPKWLKNDDKTKNITFRGISKEVEKINNKIDVTLADLLEYYYSRFCEIQFNAIPKFWQDAIINNVSDNRNLTVSNMNKYIMECCKTDCNGKLIINSLQNQTVSRVTLYLLNEKAIVAESLKQIKKLFMLAALYSGCFDDMQVDEAINCYQTFTNVKNLYRNNPKMFKPNVSLRLKGDDDDKKATIVAQHVVLGNGKINANPLIIAEQMQYNSQSDNYPIEEIKYDNIPNYVGTPRAEMEAILRQVCDPQEVRSAENSLQYWLVINNKKYELFVKDGKFVTKAATIKFPKSSIIKVCYSSERNIKDAINLFSKFKSLDEAVQFNVEGKNINIADYFLLSNDELAVSKDKSFQIEPTDKHELYFEVKKDGDSLRASKMVITSEPKKLGDSKDDDEDKDKEDKEDKKKDKETKPDDTNDSNNITDDQARDAIKKYLYQQDLAIFKGTGKQKRIADFIDRRIFNGKSLPDRYMSLINSVIKEIQKDPKLYRFDTELNEIKQLDGTSMLDVLIDVLNGNMADAIATKEANERGQNIPGIKVDKTTTPPNITAKDVAARLADYAAILNQESTNGTNKTSKDTINKILPDELAKLISWFNNRYSKSNQVSVDSTQNGNKK